MAFSDGGGSLQSSLPEKLLDKAPPPDAKVEDIYDQWGFTIYRTAYGGQTDIYWEALLQTIHANLRASITYYHGDKPREEGEEAGKLLPELFRLDGRSSLNLEGKTLDELRDSYHKEPFCWTRLDPFEEEEHPRPGVFLVADADVLKRVEFGIFVFKCIDMDFYQRDRMPNSRVVQNYWGWMPMSPIAILPLYQRLRDGSALEDFAPSAGPTQTMATWTHYEQVINW